MGDAPRTVRVKRIEDDRLAEGFERIEITVPTGNGLKKEVRTGPYYDTTTGKSYWVVEIDGKTRRMSRIETQ